VLLVAGVAGLVAATARGLRRDRTGDDDTLTDTYDDTTILEGEDR
jgi:hypothetical protein